MLQLLISNPSPELKAFRKEVAPDTEPWLGFKKFWQFSNLYGEYQSRSPRQRRQFIIDHENKK